MGEGGGVKYHWMENSIHLFFETSPSECLKKLIYYYIYMAC